MEIIGLIVAGIIIGLLGKLVAPGDKDNIPIWLTVLCGIAGVLIGYYLAAALGVDATKGIDWVRWIISIIVAAVLVIAASTIRKRRLSPGLTRITRVSSAPASATSQRPGSSTMRPRKSCSAARISCAYSSTGNGASWPRR